VAALRAWPVGPLHRGLLRPRWIRGNSIDQVFENAPPAGFEPAHTAPEVAALQTSDLREHARGASVRSRIGHHGEAVAELLIRQAVDRPSGNRDSGPILNACLAVLAGPTPCGGCANTFSVPLILVAVVTGAAARKARAWLTLVQTAITLAASTASPSAPVAASGPRGPLMLLTWLPVQSGGRIGSFRVPVWPGSPSARRSAGGPVSGFCGGPVPRGTVRRTVFPA